MGEARRKREQAASQNASAGTDARAVIDLHMLAPVPELNGRRIKELTSDESLPFADSIQVIVQAFRAVVGVGHRLAAFAQLYRRGAARTVRMLKH